MRTLNSSLLKFEIFVQIQNKTNTITARQSLHVTTKTTGGTWIWELVIQSAWFLYTTDGTGSLNHNLINNRSILADHGYQDLSRIQIISTYIPTLSCCEKYIDGAKVYLDYDPRTKRGHLCGTIHFMPGYRVYPVNCDGHSGRKVYVVQDKNYLQLAEVQVYGKGKSSLLQTCM